MNRSRLAITERSRWTVASRLRLMSAMIVLSGVVGVIGAIEISKCAQMHELNSLHLKHNYLFSNEVRRFTAYQLPSTEAIREQLLNVRAQPVQCLEMIDWFGKLVTKLLGTDKALAICEQDVMLADLTLEAVSDFNKGLLARSDLLKKLEVAEVEFNNNSVCFEPLVGRTVQAVSTMVIGLTIIKAVFVGVFCLTLARGVGRDYDRLQVAEASLEKSNENLERRVAERTQDLQEATQRVQLELEEKGQALTKLREVQGQLVEASRAAGVAEIANGVVHNIGNVLNSVNVSVADIQSQLSGREFKIFQRLAGLAGEHEHDFQRFVTENPQGEKFPSLLVSVSDKLTGQRQRISDELDSLTKSIQHLKEIVAAHQGVARNKRIIESLSVEQLIQESLDSSKGVLDVSELDLTIDVEEGLPELVTDKHGVLQILINIVKNAVESVKESEAARPAVEIRGRAADHGVAIQVVDNGGGIPSDRLNQIFQHGFTTKANGSGFGLHSSANAATSLGGTLKAESEGVGLGASFTLTLPLQAPTDSTSRPGADSRELAGSSVS